MSRYNAETYDASARHNRYIAKRDERIKWQKKYHKQNREHRLEVMKAYDRKRRAKSKKAS